MRKNPNLKILEKINNLFSKAKTNPEIAKKYVEKARNLAKRNNISLKNYRKFFCKCCNSYFNSENSKIRIKKGMKTIKCLKCGTYRKFKLF